MTMQKSLYNLLLTVALLITANLSIAEEANPQVMLKTEAGDIVIELYPKAAPVTVDNFVKLVNDFHYDGLIFHRVIEGFMIQTR